MHIERIEVHWRIAVVQKLIFTVHLAPKACIHHPFLPGILLLLFSITAEWLRKGIGNLGGGPFLNPVVLFLNLCKNRATVMYAFIVRHALVKNTVTVKGILHHSCLVSCCFFSSEFRETERGRSCMLPLLVGWNGELEMDVYKRESLWPLEPYNDQKLRVKAPRSS